MVFRRFSQDVPIKHIISPFSHAHGHDPALSISPEGILQKSARLGIRNSLQGGAPKIAKVVYNSNN